MSKKALSFVRLNYLKILGVRHKSASKGAQPAKSSQDKSACKGAQSAKGSKDKSVCKGSQPPKCSLEKSPCMDAQKKKKSKEPLPGCCDQPCCVGAMRGNAVCVADPCEDLRKVKLDILCKNAIITGGNSGIGYAAAYELLSNGARTVVIANPDEKKGRKAAQCLCDLFGMNKALYFPCDIRCSKQFEDLFLYLKRSCLSIDILLNNAGVLDDKNWECSININVIGTLRGMLLAYKYMKGHNSVVINTCATAGLSPWANCPIFAASKHAIVTASRCFGHPFHYDKTKIRVIGLCPGFTNTSIWEKGVRRHLDNEWGKLTMGGITKMNMQSASLVGRAMIHLIKYGNSGKIYVCQRGILHRAAFPLEEDILQPEKMCSI